MIKEKLAKYKRSAEEFLYYLKTTDEPLYTVFGLVSGGIASALGRITGTIDPSDWLLPAILLYIPTSVGLVVDLYRIKKLSLN